MAKRPGDAEVREAAQAHPRPFPAARLREKDCGRGRGRGVSTRRAVAAVCLLLARPLVADGGRAAEGAAWLTGTFELKDPGIDGAPEGPRVGIVGAGQGGT